MTSGGVHLDELKRDSHRTGRGRVHAFCRPSHQDVPRPLMDVDKDEDRRRLESSPLVRSFGPRSGLVGHVFLVHRQDRG